MAFGFIYTLPPITGVHSDYVVQLKTADFPLAALDGTDDAISEFGGSLRFYTGIDKTVRLSIEVINGFSSSGSPFALVYVKTPLAFTGSSFYVEADDFSNVQPAFNQPFGRDDVWAKYEVVLHMSEQSTDGVFIDSTGNGRDTTLTTGATLPTTTNQHPFGMTWPLFDEDAALTLTASAQMLNTSNLTISHWISSDSTSSSRSAFGNEYLPDDNYVQQRSTTEIEIMDDTFQDEAEAGAYTTVDAHLVYGTYDKLSLSSYLDGVLVATSFPTLTLNGISSIVSNDYRVGTREGDAINDRFKGRICEVRAIRDALLSDYIDTDFDNQDSALAWGVVGNWVQATGTQDCAINLNSFICSSEIPVTTSEATLREGDVGKIVRLNAKFDLSGNSELRVVFKDPAGNKIIKLKADGVTAPDVDITVNVGGIETILLANEYFEYRTEVGLLDQQGVWFVHGEYVDNTPKDFAGNVACFTALPRC